MSQSANNTFPGHSRLAAALVVTILAGCANTSPEWESTFGDASRQLRSQQLIDPAAPTRNQGTASAAEGRSVREATDRYVDSYKAPPPSNIISIGVGGAAR